MRPDQFKKKHQASRVDDRVRRQIAVEAARRMIGVLAPDENDPSGRLKDAAEGEFYAAKRKAAAVLGVPVRPGDLPSDSEVREQVLALIASETEVGELADEGPETDETLARLADHVDRFAIYRLRLTPLESVNQNARYHPEGDALYHSLQVFDRAREVRPYDEEFLLAALLHDVGKAINPQDHAVAAVESLRGAVTDRTLALIEHHMDLIPGREKARSTVSTDFPGYKDDLALLREVDEAGRAVGIDVGTIDEALGYIKGLESEEYLDPTPG